MRPKKIVIIANVPSSILIFRKELIQELIRQRHQVYCLAYGFSVKDEQTIEGWGGIPLNHHINPKGLNPLTDLKATFLLYKQLLKIAPDIVLACFIKPVIFSSLAAKLAKVKHKIGMLEGLGNAFINYKGGLNKKAQWIKLIQIALYKATLPLLDTLILLNPDDKHDLIDRYNIKVKRLHILGGIGVDLNQFQYSKPIIQDKIIFLFIGRLVVSKGIFEFIEAAKRVKKRYPNSIFRVVGDVDANNPFSIQSNELSESINEGVIEYIGYSNDIVPIIKESHVFVLPSYREGVPRSTQEAMAIGRAIITTNVPGCNLTVQNNENGFLVDCYDTKALEEKMSFFIQNPCVIEDMGQKSRQLAEKNFDINKINNTLIQLLMK